VPDSVIKRAKAVLKTLETSTGGRFSCAPNGAQENRPPVPQLSLLDMGVSEIAATLSSTDLNTLTPLEALSLLFEMKKLL